MLVKVMRLKSIKCLLCLIELSIKKDSNALVSKNIQ